MSDYLLKCSVCGTTTEAQATNVQDLQAAKEGHVFICQPCQAKIRYESEQKYK